MPYRAPPAHSSSPSCRSFSSAQSWKLGKTPKTYGTTFAAALLLLDSLELDARLLVPIERLLDIAAVVGQPIAQRGEYGSCDVDDQLLIERALL